MEDTMLEGIGASSARLMAAVAAVVVLGGCQSGPASAPPDTGLTTLGPGSGHSAAAPATSADAEIARLAEQAARDLESMKSPGAIGQRALDAPASVPLEIEASTDSSAPETKATTATPSGPLAGTVPAGLSSKKTGSTPVVTPLPPREAAAAELGAAVAKALRSLHDEAGSEHVVGQLVGVLEALQPGFLVGIEDKGSALYQTLGEADASEILRHRQFVPAGSTVSAAANDAPETAPVPLVTPTLNISDVRLCTRVTSFGRYEPLTSETFAAGKPIRALVYAEVENFGDKDFTDGQRLVELSQKLALFPENGTAEIWSTREQTVREAARRTRRDFYLVQQVDLPRNLSLGSYFLKVTVMDRITGAQAEKNLTIRVVAEDRAASGE
jgi:hypothetical protein